MPKGAKSVSEEDCGSGECCSEDVLKRVAAHATQTVVASDTPRIMPRDLADDFEDETYVCSVRVDAGREVSYLYHRSRG